MKQPFVCFFGGEFSDIQKNKIAETSTPYFYQNDTQLAKIIKEIRPHVFVTVGDKFENFKRLMALPLRERQRWIHYDNVSIVMNSLGRIYHCFVDHSIRYHNDSELVSIFTTSYNSGKYIERPYESLIKQTYQHWEWVIVDDSNGDENFRNLVRLQERDPNRIRIYRPEKNSGVIGNVKQLASSLCRGGYLVEMDHDDELTPKALEYLVKAGNMFPDAGFFYSDFTEIHENGDNFCYGDNFALGYGAYRKQYDPKFQKWVNICASSPINHMTIRYLVSCPNHYRAWRMSTFKEIGGWNPNFHVADDYEIIVRSFLNTKMVRIPFHSYYQYRNAGGNNHTFIRNKEIQKLWKTISRYYNIKISKRLKELTGSDPFMENWENWKQLNRCWLHSRYEKALNYTFPIKDSENKALVSVVMTCEGVSENQEEVRSEILLALNKLLKQSYNNIEVMIVGNKCCILDNVMDGLLQDSGEIDLERIKKDINWWNFQQKTDLIDCRNFATKLINLGSLTFIVDQERLDDLDVFFGNCLIERAVDLLRQNPLLNFVVLRNTNHVIYRSKLHEKYGHWQKENDLLQIWKESGEPWQMI